MCRQSAMLSGVKAVAFQVRVAAGDRQVVYVVGSCPELGSWSHLGAVKLSREEVDTERLWSALVYLPENEIIQYRYFIGTEETLPSGGRGVTVHQWETHLKPRVVDFSKPGEIDNFGVYDGAVKVQKGWLTCQNEVHLRLYGDALQFWPSQLHQQVSIKCVPHHLPKQEYISQLSSDDATGDEQQVLTSVLNAQDCIPTAQGLYGVPYNSVSYTTFRWQTVSLQTQLCRLEVYSQASDQPTLLGYSQLLPAHFAPLCGETTLPVSSPAGTLIGQIKVDLLIVKPLPCSSISMDATYQQRWNYSHGTHHIGHRGMGSSFKADRCATVTENTIASFNGAGKCGADFIEFDLMLTKDKQTVIYHDYQICLDAESKNDNSSVKETPLQEFTYDELQTLQLYHVSAKQAGKQDRLSLSKDVPQSERVFPTLQEMFEKVNPDISFNVEVKYCMKQKDGSLEEGITQFEERNAYVDTVLMDLFQHADDREVVFSCFDPDVCTMLRLKQNKYPVVMLTSGATTRWEPYMDLRTRSIHSAMHMAAAEEYLGINAHTEDLLAEPALISQVKNAGLVLWCWGSDANNTHNISQLQAAGIDGICYDRMYELKPQSQGEPKISSPGKSRMD